MSPLSPLRRRAPWVAGALLLALVGLPLLGATLRLGLRYWPFFVGAGATLLLAAGSVERWWQSRPVRPRSRSVSRSRLRVVEGGRREPGLPGMEDDEKDDEPRWLM
jgi:hypothetical protein